MTFDMLTFIRLQIYTSRSMKVAFFSGAPHAFTVFLLMWFRSEYLTLLILPYHIWCSCNFYVATQDCYYVLRAIYSVYMGTMIV